MNEYRIHEFVRRIQSPEFTTPVEITKELLEFCRSILGVDDLPVFMKVIPEDWVRQDSCIYNVEEMVRKNGGKVIYGHKIWALKNEYFEAQPHAVWEALDGKITDITFNTTGEQTILFLRDNKLSTVKIKKANERKKWATTPEISMILRELDHIGERIDVESYSKKQTWKRFPPYKEWKRASKL